MFCDSCGRGITDHVTHCPYCGQATGAVVTSAPSGAAAVAVQVRRVKPDEHTGSGLTRAEQTIYFRLARGFSWFLLVIISFAMVWIAIALIPVLSQVIGTSTKISAEDLTQSASSSRSFGAEEENELNPAEMAQLDQLAYEIIQLLPAELRSNGGIDVLRDQIKNSVRGLSRERKEQMTILRELRDDLSAVPEGQRSKALGNYFNLKSQRIQLDRTKKEEARTSLVLLGSSMLSGIALLTLITMILVLLSIERNTRTSTT